MVPQIFPKNIDFFYNSELCTNAAEMRPQACIKIEDIYRDIKSGHMFSYSDNFVVL